VKVSAKVSAEGEHARLGESDNLLPDTRLRGDRKEQAPLSGYLLGWLAGSGDCLEALRPGYPPRSLTTVFMAALTAARLPRPSP
jgi:hypothetical protein